jgi:hypothetical protein
MATTAFWDLDRVTAVQGAPAEVTALIVEWAKERRRAGDTLEAIGKVLGVTKTAVQHLVATSRGVGPKIEAHFAAKFYAGSIDGLRRAAHEAASAREPSSSAPPNLGEAIEFLRSRRRPVESVVEKARLVAATTGDLQVATWIAVLHDLLDADASANKPKS